MFLIDKVLLSDHLLEKQFVCDLSKCKGACCVEGDAGAPLLTEELAILEDIYESVKPFLSQEGIEKMEESGLYVQDTDGSYTTPVINNRECAYVVYDAHNTAKCGIEMAHKAGKTDFLKPISCHLYPIRVSQYGTYEALNYHKWDICDAACTLGESLQVKVYAFLREALTRKYGQEWFDELIKIDQARKDAGF